MQVREFNNARISVVVVTYNEERNIEECLRSLIDQEYPKDDYEIIVVDGCSNDKTQEMVEKMMSDASLPKIELFKNPARTISSNRNVGIKEAKHQYVAFTDADCICPPNWLSKLSKGLQSQSDPEKIVAVGGGNRSCDKYGMISQAIGITFQSFFSGLGTVQTKGPSNIMPVESLACLNVMYRRDVVISIGGFDERLGNIGEDWDLNFRLRKVGYQLIFLPNTEVIHKMRLDWSRFFYQMFQYGAGRARLIRKDSKSISMKYMLPLLFILGMIGMTVSGFIYDPIFLLFPIAYGVLMSLVGCYSCYVNKRLDLWLHVSLAFVFIHVGYGIGEWYGLCRPKLS